MASNPDEYDLTEEDFQGASFTSFGEETPGI